VGVNGRDRGLLSCCWCPPFSPFGAAHLGAAKFLYRPETPDCFWPIRSTCEPEGDLCSAASPVAGWPRSWGRSPVCALDRMSSRHRRASAGFLRSAAQREAPRAFTSQTFGHAVIPNLER
jgi:hypothetical protein